MMSDATKAARITQLEADIAAIDEVLSNQRGEGAQSAEAGSYRLQRWQFTALRRDRAAMIQELNTLLDPAHLFRSSIGFTFTD